MKECNSSLDPDHTTISVNVPGQTKDAEIAGLIDMLGASGIQASVAGVTLICDTCNFASAESFPSLATAVEAMPGLGWFLAGSDLYCPACKLSEGL